MNQPTIIIVGTGRSGTSFVAEVCHNALGICMGHYLKKPNLMSPNGFYEDLLQHGLLETLLADVIPLEEYCEHLSHSHKDCKLWGFKDSRFLYLSMRTMAAIAPKLVIRTWRPLEETVLSWQKKDLLHGLSVTPEKAEVYRKLILERETLMDAKLQFFNTLTVRMDKRVEEHELIEAIRSSLCLE